jgi:uncharacterized protein YkwD
MRVIRFLPAAAAALALLPLSASAARFLAEQPGPVGELRATRPALAWRVLPLGESKITEVDLTLNGAPVPARYADQAVAYTPDQPLAPGAYTVRCTVLLDGEWPVSRSWSFTVAPGGEVLDDIANSDEAALLRLINQERAQRNLPELAADATLTRAAREHSRYMAERGGLTHAEPLPGRTNHIERYLAAGGDTACAARGMAENVAGECSLSLAHGRLMGSPGHRRNILNPLYGRAGVGVCRSKGAIYVTEMFLR